MGYRTFSKEQCKSYLKARFTTLLPTKETWAHEKQNVNPIPGLRQMSWKEWQFFLIGFLGWTWDAFDFFAMSLNVSNMAVTFDRPVKDITWGITLVLMLRSVGAVVFGYFGDRYGRKWPLIVNLACLVVIQIGTGFVDTYQAFLGVRALFGVFMGSMYGLASATALEGVPIRARSFLSGLFQQGYAFGYLLVVVFQRAITDNSPKGWRAIFWFSAGPPVLFILWRCFLPETDQFLQQKLHLQSKKSSFFADAKRAFQNEWLTLIHMIFMMAGFNFMSHGSQDLYPTLLTNQLGFGADRSTVTNSVANLGAMTGGVVIGHFSGFLGRRLSIMICCVLGGALIYPWAFVEGSSINAGAFFLQFMVQGAWGVAPIHLSELAPPEFRAFVVGTAYQLGNLASSASSTIESTIGERFPLYDDDGSVKVGVYNYSKVMAIFMGAVFAYVLVLVFIGPEKRHANINYQMSEEERLELIEEGKIITHRGAHDIEMGAMSDDEKAIVSHHDNGAPQVEGVGKSGVAA